MKDEEILKEVGVWTVYDLEANREIQKLLQKKKFAFRFDPSLEMTRQEKGKYCIKLVEQGKKIGEQSERKRILELIDNYIKKVKEVFDEMEEDKDFVKPIADGKLFTLKALKKEVEK